MVVGDVMYVVQRKENTIKILNLNITEDARNVIMMFVKPANGSHLKSHLMNDLLAKV